MDSEQIETIAIRYAREHGLQKARIKFTMYGENTNVRMIKLSQDNTDGETENMSLYIDDNTGKILNCSKSKEYRSEISDGIRMTGTASSSFCLLFELTEPICCECGCANSEKIKARFNENDELDGFFVSGEDMVEIVKNAHEAINYITFQTGRFIYFKKPRELTEWGIQSAQTEYGKATALDPLDFAGTDFASIVSTGSEYGPLVSHYASGIQALESHNYAQAIREFYLVFDFDGRHNDYRILRNVLSHASSDPKYKTNMEQLLKKYPDIQTKNNIVDVDHPKTQKRLRKEASNMRDEVKSILDENLRRPSFGNT